MVQEEEAICNKSPFSAASVKVGEETVIIQKLSEAAPEANYGPVNPTLESISSTI